MPRSIYALLRNRKDEDFLTEIFVETLSRVPALERPVIEHLTGMEGLQVRRISSQAVHGEDRPDIQVDARDGEDRPVRILIESKLESEEGWNRLPRYAALLEGWVANERIAEGCLVYLTAYHEPKKPEGVFDAYDEDRVRFRQGRWEEIHEVVNRVLPGLEDEDHTWAQELVRYLEDRKLDTPTQFHPEQIVGLAKLPNRFDCSTPAWTGTCGLPSRRSPGTPTPPRGGQTSSSNTTASCTTSTRASGGGSGWGS